MTNSADGTTWIEADPAITDPRRDGAQEIRGLRKGLKIRLDKEHEPLATNSDGGEHLRGSAKAYRASSAPTLRPDGLTTLGNNDKGRLWFDTGTDVLKVWDGSTWVLATPDLTGDIPFSSLVSGDYGATILVGHDVDCLMIRSNQSGSPLIFTAHNQKSAVRTGGDELLHALLIITGTGASTSIRIDLIAAPDGTTGYKGMAFKES